MTLFRGPALASPSFTTDRLHTSAPATAQVTEGRGKNVKA